MPHANSISNSEYKSRLHRLNPSIRSIDRYVNSDTKIRHRCCTCRYTWLLAPSNAYRHGCPKCKGFNNKSKVPGDYAKSLRRVHPKVVLLDDYVNAGTKLNARCELGHDFVIIPRTALKAKIPCNRCRNVASAKHLSRGDASYSKLLNSLYGNNLTCMSPYVNNWTYLDHRCVKGHRFKATPTQLTNVRKWSQGECPLCFKARTKHQQSGVALEVISRISKRSRLKFQTILDGSEYKVPGTRYLLDAYNARHNIGIEFHGDYYHGAHDKRTKKYRNTVKRDKTISADINLIVVWESAFLADPFGTVTWALSRIDTVRKVR